MGVDSREDDFHEMDFFFERILQFSGIIEYEDSSLKSTKPAGILTQPAVCH